MCLKNFQKVEVAPITNRLNVRISQTTKAIAAKPTQNKSFQVL